MVRKKGVRFYMFAAALILVSAFVFGVVSKSPVEEAKAEDVWVGLGTSANPYKIYDANDFLRIARIDIENNTTEGKYYRVMNDFAFSPEIPSYNFAPLIKDAGKYFMGHFDGGGHIISGVVKSLGEPTNSTNASKKIENSISLFGAIADAVVENLTIELTGNGFKGSLAASGVAYTADNSVVRNVIIAGASANSIIRSNSANYPGKANPTGGIVSVAYNTSIQNCSVKVNVSGQGIVGGIVGKAERFDSRADYRGQEVDYNSAIKNCVMKGQTSGASNALVGGIVGIIETVGDFSGNYCLGDALITSGTGTAAGFAAKVSNDPFVIDEDYLDVVIKDNFVSGNISHYSGTAGDYLAGFIYSYGIILHPINISNNIATGNVKKYDNFDLFAFSPKPTIKISDPKKPEELIDAVTFSNNYYNKSNNNYNAVDEVVETATGKTTQELTTPTSYDSSFNIGGKWRMTPGFYPYFDYMESQNFDDAISDLTDTLTEDLATVTYSYGSIINETANEGMNYADTTPVMVNRTLRASATNVSIINDFVTATLDPMVATPNSYYFNIVNTHYLIRPYNYTFKNVPTHSVSFRLSGLEGKTENITSGGTLSNPLTNIIPSAYNGLEIVWKYTSSANESSDWNTWSDWVDEATPITSNTVVQGKVFASVTFTLEGSGAQIVRKAEYGSPLASFPTITDFGGQVESGKEMHYYYSGGAAVEQTANITANLNITAKYETALLQVTFNANGGSSVPSQYIASGAKASKPADPELPNYTFKGWFKDTGLIVVFDFDTDTISSATTLYAKWELNKYTVTFMSDGSVYETKTGIVHGSTVAVPSTAPTKTGHTFEGWVTTDGGTTAFTTSTVITSDMTVYAKWKTIQHTVTFDCQGGTPIPPQQTVDYNTLAVLPSDPTKTHYTFGGWYKETTCNTPFLFGIMTITEDITLYAKWTPVNYIITFDTNGGTTANYSITVPYGALIPDQADPIKQYNKFLRWKYNSTAITFGTSVVVGPMTLIAEWETATYTVSFEPDNDTTITPISVQGGKKVTLPPNPTKTGHGFEGWYTDPDFVTAFNKEDPIGSSLTLYAKWSANTYTVTFMLDGGTITNSTLAVQSIDYSMCATAPAVSKAGHTFVRWDGDYTYITEDTTVTAVWQINSYNVTFAIGYGTRTGGGLLTQSIVYLRPAEAPVITPPTGYTFGRWDKDFNSIEGDITVNAVYIIIKYAITFNTDGGSSVTVGDVAHGSTVTRPATDPTRTGYKFEGWFADSAKETSYDFQTPITMPTTIYAKWSELILRVSFNTNGGDPIEERAVKYNDTTTAVTPLKDGYTFVAWYTDAGFSDIFNFSTPITKDTVLYAKWNINLYTVTFISNGSVFATETNVSHGSTVTPPESNPDNKTGYNFVKWCIDAAGNTEFIFGTGNIIKDTNIYAGFEKKTFTVTFHSEGDVNIASQQVKYQEKATPPSGFSRTGHEFDSWRTVSALGLEFNFNTEITSSIDLYAKWNKIIYTVSFVVGVGGNAVADQKVAYEAKATDPGNPAKISHNFLGWYIDSGYSVLYDFNTPITAHTNIYAGFEIKTFTVTFSIGDGTHKGGGALTQTIDYGGSAVEPIVELTGHTYIWDTAFSNVTSDITVNAVYTICTYTISFDSKGGSSVSPQGVNYLGKVSVPQAPTMEHYTFAYWCTDDECESKYDFDTEVTGSTTLFAKWNVKFYKVEFVTGSGSTIPDVSIEYNKKASRPEEDPTQNAHDFLGWYEAADYAKEFNFETLITGETKIYAKWELKSYTVIFAIGDGTLVSGDLTQSIKHGSGATAPVVVRSGYEYDWDAAFDNITEAKIITAVYVKLYTVTFSIGSGTLVSGDITQILRAGRSATAPVVTPATGYTFDGWNKEFTNIDSDITVNAVYLIKNYTITFEPNNGSTLLSATVEHFKFISKPDVVKTGHVLVGWYSDKAPDVKWDFAVDSPTENLTLTAKWRAVIYTVSIESNGYKIVVVLKAYGEELESEDMTVRSGYTFEGWYTDSGLTQEYSGGAVEDNMTLYAKWSKNTTAAKGGCSGEMSVGSIIIALMAIAGCGALTFMRKKAKQ